MIKKTDDFHDVAFESHKIILYESTISCFSSSDLRFAVYFAQEIVAAMPLEERIWCNFPRDSTCPYDQINRREKRVVMLACICVQ